MYVSSVEELGFWLMDKMNWMAWEENGKVYDSMVHGSGQETMRRVSVWEYKREILDIYTDGVRESQEYPMSTCTYNRSYT